MKKNTNSNLVIVKKARGGSTPKQPLPKRQSKQNDLQSKLPVRGVKKGLLQPRKLISEESPDGEVFLRENEKLNANEERIQNQATDQPQVQRGHRRSRSRSRSHSQEVTTVADVHRDSNQVSSLFDDEAAMQNDGVLVGVPESEDNFGDSESEYEQDQEQYQHQRQPHQCSEERLDKPDEEIELTLSTKKKFLRKELERDLQLREVFDNLVNETAEEKISQTRKASECSDGNNQGRINLHNKMHNRMQMRHNFVDKSP